MCDNNQMTFPKEKKKILKNSEKKKKKIQFFYFSVSNFVFPLEILSGRGSCTLSWCQLRQVICYVW